MSTLLKKICILGDFGVGKTSLVHRFVNHQFSSQYVASVGVKISPKKLKLYQCKELLEPNLELLIWDLEGYTKFPEIVLSYLRGASGAIIVADVTRQETIKNLSKHIELFLSINFNGAIIVTLNKADLVSEEKLAFAVAGNQLKELGRKGEIYQTSAKTGAGVNEMFQALAYKMTTSTAPMLLNSGCK